MLMFDAITNQRFAVYLSTFTPHILRLLIFNKNLVTLINKNLVTLINKYPCYFNIFTNCQPISQKLHITLKMQFLSEVLQNCCSDKFREIHNKTPKYNAFTKKTWLTFSYNVTGLYDWSFPVNSARFFTKLFYRTNPGECFWNYDNHVFVHHYNNMLKFILPFISKQEF